MNKNVQKKIREFVEQERAAPVDTALLGKLRGFLTEDTLYWDWDPARRNAFNIFLRELTDEFTREALQGEYGAQVVLESLIVTAFESGYRLCLAGTND
jgi:hypothetical protein